TPAHEAGVLAGDLIIRIDDKSTEGLRINDAVRLIQGEPGTKISLTVVHEGSDETETLTMNRAMIEVQTVLGLNRRPDNPKEFDWYADKAHGIGYVRVVQFTEHTFEDLKKTV